jgi:hypothetical protein
VLEKCIYLITVKVDKLAALLTFHVIALSLAAVLRAYKFIASRRFLIDDVLIYQAVSRKAVQTSVYRGLADVYSLFSEMIGYLLAREMRTRIILKEIKDLTRLFSII